MASTRTLEQVVLDDFSCEDRTLIRMYLDHNNRRAALHFVRGRGKMPMMANAIIDYIDDV